MAFIKITGAKRRNNKGDISWSPLFAAKIKTNKSTPSSSFYLIFFGVVFIRKTKYTTKDASWNCGERRARVKEGCLSCSFYTGPWHSHGGSHDRQRSYLQPGFRDLGSIWQAVRPIAHRSCLTFRLVFVLPQNKSIRRELQYGGCSRSRLQKTYWVFIFFFTFLSKPKRLNMSKSWNYFRNQKGVERD